MKIDSKNTYIINSEMHFHDYIFNEFKYDYEYNTIKTVLQSYLEGKFVRIEFFNVIGFNMISCDFWGRSPRISSIAVLEKDEYTLIPKLYEEKIKKEYIFSRLKKQDDYFEIFIEFISGDRLIIACEYINIDNI